MNTAAIMTWAQSQFSDERQDSYETYTGYWSGEQPLAFATDKFKSAFGQTFEEFAYNRCDSVIGAMADRLQVTGFGANDNDTVGKNARAIWDDNDMGIRERQVEQEALGNGDAYVVVEQHPVTGDVIIWPQKATQMRVQYRPDLPGVLQFAVKQWRDTEGYIRLTVYKPGMIEKYRSRSKTGGGGDTTTGGSPARTFEPYRPEGERAWPIRIKGAPDTVPVFHFANRAPVNGYGSSELRDVVPIQNALNKTMMDLLVAMEFAAFPQRVLIDVDTDDPEVERQLERFQAGIDRLISLWGVDGEGRPRIDEFSAADVGQYVKPINLFDTIISRVSKVPVHYLQLSGDFPSGAALRTAEAPFVAKIEDMQRRFGPVWARMMRYALRLSGVETGAGLLKVNWQTAAPLSEHEQLEMMVTRRRDLGLPLATTLRLAGFDPTEIATILEEEEEEALRRARRFNAGDIEARRDDDLPITQRGGGRVERAA
jgi:hypothetical protein